MEALGGVPFQGCRAEVHVLAGGVQIPETPLNGVAGVRRAGAGQTEHGVDGLACCAHRLLRGELEADALLDGRRVAGAGGVP